MKQVFISYTHADWMIKDRVAHQIKEMGYQVWFDKEITPGTEWREEIDREIRNSFALALILTDNAVKSEYVIYEWSFALGIGISVIPIMCRGTNVPPRLATKQVIDLTSHSYEPMAWNQLRVALQIEERHYDDEKLYDHPERFGSPIAVSLFDAVITFLDSKIPNERRDAVQMLGLIGNPDAIDRLVAATYDRDEVVRNAAIRSLIHFSNEDIFETLVSQLSHETYESRNAALTSLAEIGEPVIPLLIECVTGPDKGIRRNGREVARMNALRTLHYVYRKNGRGDELMPILHYALDYPDYDVKGIAVQALADFPIEAEAALAKLKLLLNVKTEVFVDRRTTQPLDEKVAETLLAIGSREAKLMYLEWYYINADDEYKDNNEF